MQSQANPGQWARQKHVVFSAHTCRRSLPLTRVCLGPGVHQIVHPDIQSSSILAQSLLTTTGPPASRRIGICAMRAGTAPYPTWLLMVGECPMPAKGYGCPLPVEIRDQPRDQLIAPSVHVAPTYAKITTVAYLQCWFYSLRVTMSVRLIVHAAPAPSGSAARVDDSSSRSEKRPGIPILVHVVAPTLPELHHVPVPGVAVGEVEAQACCQSRNKTILRSIAARLPAPQPRP